MLDAEFLRQRVTRLQLIAADADPFIKKRLLQLVAAYERRLGHDPRSVAKLPRLEMKGDG